jgi:hypothetical protein
VARGVHDLDAVGEQGRHLWHRRLAVHEQGAVPHHTALRGEGGRRDGHRRVPGRQRTLYIGAHLSAQRGIDLDEQQLGVQDAADRAVRARPRLGGGAPAVVGADGHHLDVGQRLTERDGDGEPADRERGCGVGRTRQVVGDDGEAADRADGSHCDRCLRPHAATSHRGYVGTLTPSTKLL